MTITLNNNAKGVLSGTGLSGTGPYTIASDTPANVQAKLRAISFNPTNNYAPVGSQDTTSFTIVANDGTEDGSDSTTTVLSMSMNDVTTDLTMNNTSVNQSGGANTNVGIFSPVDSDIAETFTYGLVAGDGDRDNNFFNINNATLQANDASIMAAGDYNIRVNVNDGHGNFEKAFTITVVDNVAPILSTLNPVDDAVDVAADTNLVLTLNENIVAGTGNIIIYDSTDAVIESIPVGDAKVTISGGVVTINPTANLALDTLHYVKIASGVLLDAAGNSYAGITNTTDWSFTTIANNTPTIATISNFALDEDFTTNNISVTVSDADSDNLKISVDINDTSIVTAPITQTDWLEYATYNGNALPMEIRSVANAHGNVELNITVEDSKGATKSEIFILTVNSIDDAPVASNMAATVGPNSQEAFNTFTPTYTDVENDNPIMLKIESLPTVGTFETNTSDNNWTEITSVPFEVPMTDLANYRFNAGDNSGQNTNVDWSIMTSTDDTYGNGLWSNTATGVVTIIDSANNNAPDINISSSTDNNISTDTITINEDENLTGITISFSDDYTPTAFLAGIVDFNDTSILDMSGVTMDTSLQGSDGNITFTFTPKANTYGDVLVTLGANDGDKNSTKSFTLSVTSVNDLPTAMNFEKTINEDNNYNFSSLVVTSIYTDTNDSTQDVNEQYPDIFTIETLPNHGMLHLGDSVALTADTNVSLANLTNLVYTPQENNNTDVTFNWKASDGDAYTSTKTATIHITAQNDTPTDIALSSTSVDQSDVISTGVATLSSTDVDTSSFTYTLVSGTGDTDNSDFYVDGTVLKANNPSSLAEGTYSIRVNTFDGIENYEKTFSIVISDNVAPLATTFSPDDNSTTTLIDANLTIAFDENIQVGTGDIVIKYDTNDSVVETFDIATSDKISINNTTLTINPTNNLAFNTKYYVEIANTAIKDRANTPNNYAGISVKGDWDFTTYDKLSLTNLEGANITYTEGDGNVSISSLIEVINPSNENITGATVEISSNFVSSEDKLHFTDANGITGNFNTSSGILSLSGDANLTNYQIALRSITYENTNLSDINATSRVLDINITDRLAISTTVQRTIAITAVDNTPDAFSFTPLTNQSQSTVLESETVVITGIENGITISVSGGEYKIGNGAYTASAGTIDNDDNVTLKQTSSASYSTLTTTSLTIGDTTQGFAVTTKSAPVSSGGGSTYTPPPEPEVEEPVVVEPEPEVEEPVTVEPEPEEPIVVEPTPEPEAPGVEKPTVSIEEILKIKEVVNETQIETKIDEDIQQKDTGIILDEEGMKEQFSVKEDTEIIINENGGSEVNTEVIKENGESVETKATVNTNGTLEASLKTDADQEGVTLKSANPDTQVEIKDDGSLEMTFDLKDEGDFGKTTVVSDLDTDKEIVGSVIKALASDDEDAVAGSIIELKVIDADGNEESVEITTVSKVQNSSVVITGEGTVQTQANSEVILKDENGEDKSVDVQAVVQSDKFGKTSSELTITDSDGKETMVSFGSDLAGTSTDMNIDGSIETKATLGTTEVSSQIKADGKTSSSITIQVVDVTTGESTAVELKTSSDLEGAKTTLAKDGSVETIVATKVEALDANGATQEIDVELSVKGDTSGETTHSIVARDTNGEVLFETKATSELKGAETKITASGSLETKASTTNDDGQAVELKIETDINGNTTHTVSVTDLDGNEVVSNATSEIQGSSTVIQADGNLETKATPTEYSIDGKTIEAIVDTLPNGEAYTRFEITDLATGEVTTQETTQEGSSFEPGNKVVIKEENGVLKLSVDTKVTKLIEF